MADTAIDLVPDIQGLVTEDDTPVDNLASEKHQRLLTETLYSSWDGPGAGRPFLAAANVGVFALARNPAIVPDVFLSLDVEVAQDWWQKEHRSYLLWEFGKPPDVVIEIVSNTVGGEADEKHQKYARMRVIYYVIYDPLRQVMPDVLTIYRLSGTDYERHNSLRFPDIGLGVMLWDGTYEGKADTWLRWTDADGNLILTGKERAEQERQRAEQERQRAEQERWTKNRPCNNWHRSANGLTGWRLCCDRWGTSQGSFDNRPTDRGQLCSRRCLPAPTLSSAPCVRIHSRDPHDAIV